MNNNYYRKQELVRKYLKELIDEGLNRMKDPNLSDDIYHLWINYSQRILEISTKDYNPEIYLNYLRIVMSIDAKLLPHQKISICLEYLIGALRIL
jgi:hypothetical protein